jgi:flagellar hook-length control protein FliK
LQPEQLGNVELKLNLQKGIVIAEIKVENEMVKAAIESNLDDLKQSLSNKGYAIDQFSVSVDSGKKNRQETFGQSKKNKPTVQKDLNESVESVEGLNRYLMDEYEGSTINYYG